MKTFSLAFILVAVLFKKTAAVDDCNALGLSECNALGLSECNGTVGGATACYDPTYVTCVTSPGVPSILCENPLSTCKSGQNSELQCFNTTTSNCNSVDGQYAVCDKDEGVCLINNKTTLQCFDTNALQCLSSPTGDQSILCVVGEQACATGLDATLQCYDPSSFSCKTTPYLDFSLLCSASDKACGDGSSDSPLKQLQCYNPLALSCFDSVYLCPVNMYSCNGACYVYTQYQCVGGSLTPQTRK